MERKRIFYEFTIPRRNHPINLAPKPNEYPEKYFNRPDLLASVIDVFPNTTAILYYMLEGGLAFELAKMLQARR